MLERYGRDIRDLADTLPYCDCMRAQAATSREASRDAMDVRFDRSGEQPLPQAASATNSARNITR